MSLAPAASSTPFHVLSIEGLPSTGKSRRAYGAPGRVAILSTDNGWDGVIQPNFPDWESRFLIGNYYMQLDMTPDEEFKDGNREVALKLADQQASRVRREVWQPYSNDYMSAMQNPGVRSVVLDLADQGYDFLRMANFGKLERNSQLGYVPINNEYESFVRQAHKFQKNLILIHRLSKEYKQSTGADGKEKSVETGRLKRKGPQGIEYLVHSYLRTHFTPGEMKFEVEVLKARRNPALIGTKIEVPPDWVTLMSFLDPDVAPERWEGVPE